MDFGTMGRDNNKSTGHMPDRRMDFLKGDLYIYIQLIITAKLSVNVWKMCVDRVNGGRWNVVG